MPICRICGCRFKGNSSECGVRICSNDECWKKAWRQAVKPFRTNYDDEKAENGRNSRRIPEKDKRRVIELHGQGKTRKEITTMTRLPYQTVSYILRNMQRSRRLSDAD